MEQLFSVRHLLASVFYSLMGMGIFALGFYLLDKFTPGKVWHEILEEHNTSLAIIIGSISLGISIIIASAIHGG